MFGDPRHSRAPMELQEDLMDIIWKFLVLMVVGAGLAGCKEPGSDIP